MTTAPLPYLHTVNRGELSDDARTVLSDIDEVVVFSVPMNVRFRGVTQREGLLLAGPCGWGECAPFWDYAPPEASRWLAAGVESATSPWPQPTRSSVPVNVTIPALPSEAAVKRLKTQPGCSTAKVKVAERGQLRVQDIDRVRAVAESLAARHGSDARVRVDANAGWSVQDAGRILRDLNEAAKPVGGLEYAEQPVAQVADLAELRRNTEVPLAADESIRRSVRPLEVRDLQAADLAVLKVAPLSGILEARTLGASLRLPLVVSSALDTSVGIAAGVALAASLEELPYACGLNTATMFGADVLAEPLIASGGVLTFERASAARQGPLNPRSRRTSAEVVARWVQRLNLMATELRRTQGSDY